MRLILIVFILFFASVFINCKMNEHNSNLRQSFSSLKSKSRTYTKEKKFCSYKSSKVNLFSKKKPRSTPLRYTKNPLFVLDKKSKKLFKKMNSNSNTKHNLSKYVNIDIKRKKLIHSKLKKYKSELNELQKKYRGSNVELKQEVAKMKKRLLGGL